MLEIIETQRNGSVHSFGTVKTEKAFIAFARKTIKANPWAIQLTSFASVKSWMDSVSTVDIAKNELSRFFNDATFTLVAK
jgi:hypothetical protein